MPEKIIIAIISLCGVILSMLVSWLISKYRVESEVNKLRLEMQKTYATQIHEKRLSVFPGLYKLIGTHVKEIQKQTVEHESVINYFSKLDAWHTENGYLLSSSTNSYTYTYLRKLRRISEGTNESFVARISDNEKRRELIRNAWEIELGLKSDLGIFEVEFFDPDIKIKSYKQINALVNEKNG